MNDPAVRRTTVTTDSLDRSLELIGELYTPVRVDASARGGRARFTAASREVEGFRIDRLRHSSGYRLDADPMDFVGVVMLTRGQATYSAVGRDLRFAPGRSVAFPADAALRVEHSAYDLRLVTVPAARLAAHAVDVSGQADLRFRVELGTTASRADETRWRATVDFLDRELARRDSALDSPLFRENALLLLLDAVTSAFPTNLPMLCDRAAAGWTPTHDVRAAIDFIESHAAQPVTTRRIAAAADARQADLDAAFVRARGVTAAGYLRQVRLQRAEHDLGVAAGRGAAFLAAHRRSIVTGWGFSSPQRFATLYREAFAIPSAHVTEARQR